MCFKLIKKWIVSREEESEEIFDIVNCIEPYSPTEFVVLDMEDELLKRRMDLYYILMHEDLGEEEFNSIISEIEQLKNCEDLISNEHEEQTLF